LRQCSFCTQPRGWYRLVASWYRRGPVQWSTSWTHVHLSYSQTVSPSQVRRPLLVRKQPPQSISLYHRSVLHCIKSDFCRHDILLIRINKFTVNVFLQSFDRCYHNQFRFISLTIDCLMNFFICNNSNSCNSLGLLQKIYHGCSKPLHAFRNFPVDSYYRE